MSTQFEDYILSQPADIQERLIIIYNLINDLIGSDTTEVISFQMPTFKGKHNIIHFAAFSKHIGIYPGANTILHFSDKLGEHKHSKGGFQIAHNQQIPLELLKEIVMYSYNLSK